MAKNSSYAVAMAGAAGVVFVVAIGMTLAGKENRSMVFGSREDVGAVPIEVE